MRKADPRRLIVVPVILLCGLSIVLTSVAAFAMKAPLRKPAPAEETTTAMPEPPAPAAGETAGLTQKLDRRYRFPKRMQSEISVFGGNYLGDEWLNTWDAGGRYYLHLNETFAVGAAFTVSRMRVGAASSFAQSLASKMNYLADAELMIGNNCAFRAGKSVIDCDLFATLGVGGMWINRVWEPLGIVGGGMKIYLPPPWLAIRFDVNSVLHSTPKPEGASFNADVMFNLGISFLFPIHRTEPSATP